MHLTKSSAEVSKGGGRSQSKWVWGSTPPGITNLPVASSTRAPLGACPSPSSVCRFKYTLCGDGAFSTLMLDKLGGIHLCSCRSAMHEAALRGSRAVVCV